MKLRTLAVIIGVAASFGAATWLYDRHHFSAVWPAQVQHDLFGKTVVSGDNLISSERHFAYGQGFARWRYIAAQNNPSLRRLCGNIDVGRCALSRHQKIDRGVDVFARLSGGVLTLEEWWS